VSNIIFYVVLICVIIGLFFLRKNKSFSPAKGISSLIEEISKLMDIKKMDNKTAIPGSFIIVHRGQQFLCLFTKNPLSGAYRLPDPVFMIKFPIRFHCESAQFRIRFQNSLAFKSVAPFLMPFGNVEDITDSLAQRITGLRDKHIVVTSDAKRALGILDPELTNEILSLEEHWNWIEILMNKDVEPFPDFFMCNIIFRPYLDNPQHIVKAINIAKRLFDKMTS